MKSYTFNIMLKKTLKVQEDGIIGANQLESSRE
jgi:hypothetical protein